MEVVKRIRELVAVEELLPGLSSEEISAWEKKLGVSLPDDFKKIISEFVFSREAVPGIDMKFEGQRYSYPYFLDWRLIGEDSETEMVIENLKFEDYDYSESEFIGPMKQFSPSSKVMFIGYTDNSDVLFIDFDPDSGGNFGQVVFYNLVDDIFMVINKSYEDYLWRLVESIETREEW